MQFMRDKFRVRQSA